MAGTVSPDHCAGLYGGRGCAGTAAEPGCPGTDHGTGVGASQAGVSTGRSTLSLRLGNLAVFTGCAAYLVRRSGCARQLAAIAFAVPRRALSSAGRGLASWLRRPG